MSVELDPPELGFRRRLLPEEDAYFSRLTITRPFHTRSHAVPSVTESD